MIEWLEPGQDFPPVTRALAQPNGLLAAGSDLSVPTLLKGYSHGIFPWFSDGQPILWWSPDPRMVLVPADIHITRSLAKTLRNKPYEIRVDTAFPDVVAACAAPRPDQEGTWITQPMIDAYTELYKQGWAHSVEVWMDGTLAGGLYGVALGRMFFGESMFSRARDASKIALAYLAKQLERWQFGLIDCQMHTTHLESMGAREMPRALFASRLSQLINYPGIPGHWRFENGLFERYSA